MLTVLIVALAEARAGAGAACAGAVAGTATESARAPCIASPARARDGAKMAAAHSSSVQGSRRFDRVRCAVIRSSPPPRASQLEPHVPIAERLVRVRHARTAPVR